MFSILGKSPIIYSKKNSLKKSILYQYLCLLAVVVFTISNAATALAAADSNLYIPRPGTPVAGSEAAVNAPVISADAAIMIDRENGEVLYSMNPDKREYPASTTKIMTAILTIEDNHNDDDVVVSYNAANVESTNLVPGEVMRRFDMLELMMLNSDNGAATALGESVAGSEHGFVTMMNNKAKALGALSTNFYNCNGMPNAQHYTTARDMSKIADYAMNNKLFRRVVSTDKKIIPYISPAHASLKVENTNELLKAYPDIIGVKTGYTRAAKGCLVAVATREGKELLVVVFHSDTMDTRFQEARKLLDYGFELINERKVMAI